MFNTGNQNIITPHDGEQISSEGNMEKHVDADLSEIMLKDSEQEEEDLMFSSNEQKTPKR